jgi:hypothetical protein
MASLAIGALLGKGIMQYAAVFIFIECQNGN